MKSTLFGYLAHRFASHPENLATEALCYVLTESTAATAAFCRYLFQLGGPNLNITSFETQGADTDGAIPDLVGRGIQGDLSLLVEAKFWAGLTEHQPVTYLQRLQAARPGVLMFIAPARRIASLWPELKNRCRFAEFELEREASPSSGFRLAYLPDGRCLCLTSWDSLLDALLQSLDSEGSTQLAADLRQLQGLCGRMDDEAFLPLRSEELSPAIATRSLQYCRLVDDVTTVLVNEKLASVDGLRATGGGSWYGRYLRLSEFGCCLQYNADYWSRIRETPIWLTIKDKNWKHSHSFKEALLDAKGQDNIVLLEHENKILVPLTVRCGVERQVVLEELLSQMRRASAILQRASSAAEKKPA
jgi:hypothetical protein